MGLLGAATPRASGGPPPAGAHAYWRVRVTKARGGNVFSISVGELAMRSSASQANLCTGGTPINSASFGSGFEATKAFDGSALTRWASPVGAPHWIGYHFASPVEVAQVAITSPATPVPNELPEDFVVEWSDDGVSWTAAHSVTGEPAWPIRQTRLYTFGDAPLPGAHRYWRLYITANDGSGSYMGLSELKLRDGSNFNRINGASAASASSFVNTANDAAKAFDSSNTTTGWLSSSASVGQWVAWDFQASGAYGSPVEIRYFDIYGSWNAPTASPREFELQWSDDNATWVTAVCMLGQTGWTAGQKRSFSVMGDAYPDVVVPVWRILARALDGAPSASMAELELRATVGGADLCSGGTASASSEFSATFNAAKAFDNDVNTLWSTSSGAGANAWIRYDLPSAARVNEISIRSRNDAAPEQNFKDFVVQSSLDGAAWDNEWEVVGASGWTLGQVRTFARP